MLRSQVSQKVTHINAGSRLINQGEKITSRHMDMLQAMKTALSEQRKLWHPFENFRESDFSAFVFLTLFYLFSC